MRTVLSISLPEQIAAELNKYAREVGRNKSDIVKESIVEFLWEARFRKARNALAGKAKKQGVITEEDLFRVIS